MARIDVSTGFFDAYTALVEPFFGGMTRISIAMDDPELRQGAVLIEVVTRQIETVPQLANALAFPATCPPATATRPASTARPRSPRSPSFTTASCARPTSCARRAALTPPSPRSTSPRQFTQVPRRAVRPGARHRADRRRRPATRPGQAGRATERAYIGYRNALAGALQDRADELNASATSREQRFGLLVVVTLGTAVALTVIVSLSITRPLRSLTTQAKDMAERRLPHAVAEILETPFGEDVDGARRCHRCGW